MRTNIIFALTLLLVGCQSDFQRCMDTELPRAEVKTGLEAERRVGAELVALRSQLAKVDRVATSMKPWFEANPIPSDLQLPDFPKWDCFDKTGRALSDCHEEHRKASDEWSKRLEIWESSSWMKAYRKSRDQEFVRLARENGILVDNIEGYTDYRNRLLESVETVVGPRSAIYRCLDDSECEDYKWASDDVIGIIMKASNEAILNNASKISELVETAKELAVVTCNNNGFYE